MTRWGVARSWHKANDNDSLGVILTNPKLPNSWIFRSQVFTMVRFLDGSMVPWSHGSMVPVKNIPPKKITFTTDSKMDLAFEDCVKFEKWATLLDVASKSSHSALNKSSIFKGVSWCKRIQKFKVIIYIQGVQIYVGEYDTQYEAYQGYTRACKELLGR